VENYKQSAIYLFNILTSGKIIDRYFTTRSRSKWKHPL